MIRLVVINAVAAVVGGLIAWGLLALARALDHSEPGDGKEEEGDE